MNVKCRFVTTVLINNDVINICTSFMSICEVNVDIYAISPTCFVSCKRKGLNSSQSNLQIDFLVDIQMNPKQWIHIRMTSRNRTHDCIKTEALLNTIRLIRPVDLTNLLTLTYAIIPITNFFCCAPPSFIITN